MKYFFASAYAVSIPALLAMSVEHEIKERLATEWKSRVFSYLGNTLMLIELSSEDAIVQFTDSCDRFCKWAYRVMGAVVTAGIGRVCDNMANIKTSYDGAREAVSYRVLYGTKRAINIAELAPKGQETTGMLLNSYQVHKDKNQVLVFRLSL